MDSRNFSQEPKADNGRAFANEVRRLNKSRSFRAQRRASLLGAHLSVAVASSGLSRAAIADRAGMKPTQLTRQLSGEVNLTIDSVARICEAAGYEFDVVFRTPEEPRALQPWERQINRAVLFKLVYEQTPANDSAGNISNHHCTLSALGARTDVSVLDAANEVPLTSLELNVA